MLTLTTFGLLLVLRLLFLGSDPKLLASSIIGDEGYWLHNARQQILFHSIRNDDLNVDLVVAPVYSFLTWLSFQLFGIGFFQARLVSAVFSLIALIALYWLIKTCWGQLTASVAVFILGIQPVFLAVSRLAVAETTALAFFILSLLGLGTSKWHFFTSGIFISLSFFSKTNTPAIIAYGLIVIASLVIKKINLTQLLFAIAGMALVTLIFTGLISILNLWPDISLNYLSLGASGKDHLLPASFGELLFNLKKFLKSSVWRQPSVLLLSGLSFLSIIKLKNYHFPFLVALSLIFSNILIIAPLANQGGDKQWLLLLAGLSILASFGLTKTLFRRNKLALSKIPLISISGFIAYTVFSFLTIAPIFTRPTYSLSSTSNKLSSLPQGATITGFFAHELAVSSQLLPVFWSPNNYFALNPQLNQLSADYFFEAITVDGRAGQVFSQKQKQLLDGKLKFLYPIQVLPQNGGYQIEGNLYQVIK